MNADEAMDAQLAAAGERWRMANPAATAMPEQAAPSARMDVELLPVTDRRRRSHRWLVTASAAVIVAALAGGGAWLANRPGHSKQSVDLGVPAGPGVGETTHGGLTGVVWKIFMVDTENSKGSAGLDATGSSAQFTVAADGTVQASDGCNTLSGSSAITDDVIKLQDLAMTEIGCTDTKVQSVATAVDKVLTGDVKWSIQDGGGGDFLTLQKDGVGELTFTGTVPGKPVTDPAKLTGTWAMFQTEQRSGDANSGSASGSGSDSANGFGETVTFTGKGAFSVGHRCYVTAGSVELGAGTADFGATHPDGAIPCPNLGADQQQEQQYDGLIDDTLKGAATWKIKTDGDLEITKGNVTLTFTKAAVHGG